MILGGNYFRMRWLHDISLFSNNDLIYNTTHILTLIDASSFVKGIKRAFDALDNFIPSHIWTILFFQWYFSHSSS